MSRLIAVAGAGLALVAVFVVALLAGQAARPGDRPTPSSTLPRAGVDTVASAGAIVVPNVVRLPGLRPRPPARPATHATPASPARVAASSVTTPASPAAGSGTASPSTGTAVPPKTPEVTTVPRHSSGSG